MTASIRMDESQHHMTERILNLTLEILCLLTGEVLPPAQWGDHVVIIVPPTSSLKLKKRNKQKILEVIHQVTELLTGEEIRVKDEDDAVLELECSVGNKTLSRDTITKNQLTDGSGGGNPEGSPRLLCSWDLTKEDHCIPHLNQSENWSDVKIEEEDETYMRGDQPSTMCPIDGSTAQHLHNQDHHQGAGLMPVKAESEEQEADLGDRPSAVKLEMTLTIKEEEHSRLISREDRLMRRSSEEHHDWSSDIKMEEDIPGESPGGSPDTRAMSAGLPWAGRLADPSNPKGHHGEKTFFCPKCDKYFASRTTFLKHQIVHSEVRPFSCSECRKSFKRKAHLLKHQMSHTGERPYLCAECGKCFTQKVHLITHQRSHTGERPFTCSECGKTFGYRANFNAHRKYHTGKNLHTCSVCGKKFAEKSQFERHLRAHTGEKPFSCALCSYRCVRKAELLSHHRTHTGERPYTCSMCGKGFQRKCFLQEHQKEHHQ